MLSTDTMMLSADDKILSGYNFILSDDNMILSYSTLAMVQFLGDIEAIFDGKPLIVDIFVALSL
jgi:hypothetical protein